VCLEELGTEDKGSVNKQVIVGQFEALDIRIELFTGSFYWLSGI
jgi:hypothetical protein